MRFVYCENGAKYQCRRHHQLHQQHMYQRKHDPGSGLVDDVEEFLRCQRHVCDLFLRSNVCRKAAIGQHGMREDPDSWSIVPSRLYHGLIGDLVRRHSICRQQNVLLQLHGK